MHAVPGDADEPIHIQAENAEIDQENQQVTYFGSVQINQGTLQVNAERMIVDYREQKVVRITATGSPARYLQQLEAAEGTVQANASTIIYYTQAERIDLKGNANLTQKGNRITGELIQYDIVAGKVEATAPDKGRVKMVLQPASRDDS
ncbi:MAG: lipopolysaccharide transport periplasmic protein LptA [Gammaproteobacteria bacterium]|nr:lipopolysaccharide transport periplasmic protein LptA [Gammaproteobacteria bacterium]